MKSKLPQYDFILWSSTSTGQSVPHLCNYNPLPSISAFTGHMCACICKVAKFFSRYLSFSSLLSYIPFYFLNNSCFKILRVDSGKWGNINLRLTPSAKVISHLSSTLASCHVMRTASLSHSLSPNWLHDRCHLSRPQPHCSNAAKEIREDDSRWCNLCWKSDEHVWTDAMLNRMNINCYSFLIPSRK